MAHVIQCALSNFGEKKSNYDCGCVMCNEIFPPQCPSILAVINLAHIKQYRLVNVLFVSRNANSNSIISTEMELRCCFFVLCFVMSDTDSVDFLIKLLSNKDGSMFIVTYSSCLRLNYCQLFITVAVVKTIDYHFKRSHIDSDQRIFILFQHYMAEIDF